MAGKYNINLKELIYPLFVEETKSLHKKDPVLGAIARFSPETLVKEVSSLKRLGLNKFLIFGIPEKKDDKAHSAYRKDNVVSKAVRLIKEEISNITVMTDVCLCAYTRHSHCRIVKPKTKVFDNKATLKTLANIALSYARAGADFVAPSAVLEGQVEVIRKTLDKAGYRGVRIMSYSAKFASNFYGPFREIADSAPKFGNRSGYQLDYRDSSGALSRVEQDIDEGADIIMVKPALGYLDIVRQVKNDFKHPLAVYNVSGEYSLVKKGASSGFWDEKKMVAEVISSIKRAGANYIITYHAKDIARWLQ